MMSRSLDRENIEIALKGQNDKKFFDGWIYNLRGYSLRFKEKEPIFAHQKSANDFGQLERCANNRMRVQ